MTLALDRWPLPLLRTLAHGLGRVVLEEEQERERSKSYCLYHCSRLHDRNNIEEEIFPRAKVSVTADKQQGGNSDGEVEKYFIIIIYAQRPKVSTTSQSRASSWVIQELRLKVTSHLNR